MRTLIIDQDADFTRLISMFLRTEWPDAEVVEVAPGRDGVKLATLDVSGFDAIALADDPSGQDSLAWLRQLRQRPGVAPILFFFANEDPQFAGAALRAGALDCFNKHDLSRSRLVAAFARASQRAHGGGPPPDSTLTRLKAFEVRAHAVEARKTPQLLVGGEPASVSVEGYRLIRRIGTGGMSEVYFSERESDGKLMVLKALDPRFSADHESMSTFFKRYDAVAKVDHPNVVKIFDLGLTDEHVYVAMEYFGGGSLKERIRKGITPQKAVEYTILIARALDAIHATGVVHRDVKPDNIMFRTDGTLALLDFGIARRQWEITLGERTHVFGTPAYVSPEHAMGQAVDGRSDLYSLGCMLYEMLTGEHPYRAETPVDLIYQHIHGEIPALPKALRGLQPVIDKLLAKNPDERYADGAALEVALKPFLA